MGKYKFLISIALMAAILGGLILIGANRKTNHTPSDEFTPEHNRLPSYPDYQCEGSQCEKG
jgi:hypothetical protein